MLLNIDLHTHTIFSDGELIPAELARRMEVLGYQAMALTDHVDSSRFHIVEPIIQVCRDLSKHTPMEIIPGVEITHVPPAMIKELAKEFRGMGAALIVVHGETLVEPVAEGTNRAAIEAGVDILAHPGLLSSEEAALAAKNGVALELSLRKGHCLSNGRIAALAMESGAAIVLNSDAHSPGDLTHPEWRYKVALGAGLSKDHLRKIQIYAEGIVKNKKIF